ncbi:hypothetical protein [Candidatus Binatus sp.]|uniref:hypothetical protein n=1 Tax=Candidatus Binatus sp. TaxID=2811406 RepID=UPI002FD9E93D
MKLKHDIGHHKRTAKVSLHKSERVVEQLQRKPADLPAVERAMDRALQVSSRVSKEVAELDRSLDELLAACGPLS